MYNFRRRRGKAVSTHDLGHYGLGVALVVESLVRDCQNWTPISDGLPRSRYNKQAQYAIKRVDRFVDHAGLDREIAQGDGIRYILGDTREALIP